MLCDYLSPQDSFYKALLVAYWQNKNASSYLKTIPSAQLLCVFLDWQKDHEVCVLYSQRQIGNQRQEGTYLIKTEYAFVRAKLPQSCPTHCNARDHSLPGSSVHGILQARILQWIAMPFSRESFWPRNKTSISYVSCIGKQVFFTTSTTWEAQTEYIPL